MTFPCGELTEIRHDGKGKDQFLGTDAAATDTKPRTGMESATTTDISDSCETHGNEGQHMALLVAGHCLHAAKNNRIAADTQVRASPVNA
nr:hypothetical protein [Mycolicibacterium stellerae]